jgi:hypothetical protein
VLRPFANTRFAGVPRDLLWLAVIVTAGEAVVRCRHVEGAPAVIELLEPHSGQLVVVGAGVALLGPVDRVLGLLHWVAGRPADAGRHMARALDVLAPGELAPFRAMALLARAEVGAASGADADAVATDSAEAARIAAGLGMAAVADRARVLVAGG